MGTWTHDVRDTQGDKLQASLPQQLDPTSMLICMASDRFFRDAVLSREAG